MKKLKQIQQLDTDIVVSRLVELLEQRKVVVGEVLSGADDRKPILKQLNTQIKDLLKI